jgi:hypothetical protein
MQNKNISQLPLDVGRELFIPIKLHNEEVHNLDTSSVDKQIHTASQFVHWCTLGIGCLAAVVVYRVST